MVSQGSWGVEWAIPQPLMFWPCSLFPAATSAQEEALAIEVVCKSTALSAELPTKSSHMLLEEGQGGVASHPFCH